VCFNGVLADICRCACVCLCVLVCLKVHVHPDVSCVSVFLDAGASELCLVAHACMHAEQQRATVVVFVVIVAYPFGFWLVCVFAVDVCGCWHAPTTDYFCHPNPSLLPSVRDLVSREDENRASLSRHTSLVDLGTKDLMPHMSCPNLLDAVRGE
jgi:hypothetical protein